MLLCSPLLFLFGAIILYLDHDPMFVLCLIMFIAGIVGIIISLKKNLNEYKQINLESSDFMKRFDVSSSNQVESRYLITPTFMQRLMDLKTSFGTETIKCSFFDHKNRCLCVNSLQTKRETDVEPIRIVQQS